MSLSQPVLGLYDKPMWESMARGALELQRCSACARFRYPPGPVCPYCLSPEYKWTQVSGRAEILSWVIFHRGYFEDYPPPYNVIAARLEEGPILVTNLVGEPPQGSWIGHPIELCYETHQGRMLHRARLRRSAGKG